MLEKSFVFLPGVSQDYERQLWADGVWSWEEFLATRAVRTASKRRRTSLENHIEDASQALKEQDIDYFTRRLPRRDHWRIFASFPERLTCLDIETTGLSFTYDDITTVATWSEAGGRVYMKDANLEDLKDDVTSNRILATFNGTLFDNRFLKEHLNIEIPPCHLDLRYMMRRIGYGGPLKVVEQLVGLRREGDTEGISGREAVVLWREFLGGNNGSLRKLIQYNMADAQNLRFLLDFYVRQELQAIAKELRAPRHARQRTLMDGLVQFGTDWEVEKPVAPKITVRSRQDLVDVRVNGVLQVTVAPSKVSRRIVSIPELLKQIPYDAPRAVGIDLTGSAKKASGYCELDGNNAFLDVVATDDELVERIQAFKPHVVSIDSPLSLPKGRHCHREDCWCLEKGGRIREAERELKRRGINAYPALIPSMVALTVRGIGLKDRLEALGFHVIESYPGAAQDIMHIPRKRVDLEAMADALVGIGLRVSCPRPKVTHDEWDALTSALVGYYEQAGQVEGVGDAECENLLLIPKVPEASGLEAEELATAARI